MIISSIQCDYRALQARLLESDVLKALEGASDTDLDFFFDALGGGITSSLSDGAVGPEFDAAGRTRNGAVIRFVVGDVEFVATAPRPLGPCQRHA